MSADLPSHYGWRWAGHAVGTSHSNGPQPLRSAEEGEPEYVEPEKRHPLGFTLPTPPPDPAVETEPLLYEGEYA